MSKDTSKLTTLLANRHTMFCHLVQNSSFDIKRDQDDLAYLTIDDNILLFFHSDDDIGEFVRAVGDLEIANDMFKLGEELKEDKERAKRPLA